MESTINYIVDQLRKFLFEAISDTISCKKNVELLMKKAGDLEPKKNELLKDIQDAQREGKLPTDTVQKWQDDLKEFQVKAKEVEKKFNKMLSCLPGLSPNVCKGYTLSINAKELTEVAEDLLKTIPERHEIARNKAPDMYTEGPSGFMMGRDAELEQLQQLVDDCTVRTIGIYGMAGVGKTTLLENFHNRYRLWHDHHIIWVNLNDSRSETDAQKAIAEGLGLICNKDDHGARARQIYDYLYRRPFVLILQNVWRAVNLKEVGVPTSTCNVSSKIIVETRIEDVCNGMEATKTLKIGCLGWVDARRLFEAKAGESLIGSDQIIRQQAEILVKKCGGLPLALVTIGHAMASKTTSQLWKYAVKALDYKPEQIQGMRNVLSRLKLSYDNLSDDKLKTFLLYCTLHDEDTQIYKQWIIDYCIGEGVLDDRSRSGEDVYNEGHELLDKLRGASMLEAGNDPLYVKVHPMIRVLALWIEEGGGKERKWLVRPGRELKKVPNVVEWGGVERVSLMNNKIKKLSKAPPDCSSLVTLLLANNPPLEKICEGFFHSMKNLRVLDLSHNKIKEIPTEVGDLIYLQYLDFCDTHISSLPQELGNLINLRFLLLSYTPFLKSIPEGLISRFKELRVLKMYLSYGYWKVGSVDEGEGVKLGELQRLERLKTLGISITTVEALQQLAESDQLSESTNQLEIRFCPGLTTISIAQLESDFKSLESLSIDGCKDLEDLEILGSDPLTTATLPPNLQNLTLFRLPKARITWKSGCLQALQDVQIMACKGMKHLIHVDEDDDAGIQAEKDVLPNLQSLALVDMPELVSLTCIGKKTLLAFPSLETLEVENCPKLKRIPTNAMKLREVQGEESWWNELEWPEGDNVKSNFQDKFKKLSR